jgi:hypothetical protein
MISMQAEAAGLAVLAIALVLQNFFARPNRFLKTVKRRSFFA